MSDIAPDSLKIQQESVQTTAPVSESSLSAMGGAINYLLSNAAQVGDIVPSALDEPTFQAQRDTTWVLCDGRSVIGSVFQALTSLTNIPDFRGTVPRGKDNGRGLDPHGDLTIGTYEPDQFASHVHSYTTAQYALTLINAGGSGGFNPSTTNTGAAGGSETNAKSTIINFFVKINI